MASIIRFNNNWPTSMNNDHPIEAVDRVNETQLPITLRLKGYSVRRHGAVLKSFWVALMS